MRSRIVGILFISLALSPFMLAGCDDDAASADMTLAADLAVSGGDTCLQVITCGAACAGMSACQIACAAKASPTAIAQYEALYACAYGVCSTSGDAGAAACSSATRASASCQTCVSTAAQAASCATQLNACLTGK